MTREFGIKRSGSTRKKLRQDGNRLTALGTINSCAAEASFMSQLWAGRRAMVDMLVDVGPAKSLGYRLEAGRQLGYQRLRSLRDWLRSRSAAPPPKKLGKKLGMVSP